MLQVRTHRVVETGVLRSALDEAGIKGAEITTFGSDSEFQIRARLGTQATGPGGGSEATAAAVDRALTAKLGAGTYTIVDHQAVEPKVGRELQGKAFLAIVFSFVVTLAYLAWRFEWRFGLAAVIATAHDILTTISFLVLMRWR